MGPAEAKLHPVSLHRSDSPPHPQGSRPSPLASGLQPIDARIEPPALQPLLSNSLLKVGEMDTVTAKYIITQVKETPFFFFF